MWYNTGCFQNCNAVINLIVVNESLVGRTVLSFICSNTPLCGYPIPLVSDNTVLSIICSNTPSGGYPIPLVSDNSDGEDDDILDALAAVSDDDDEDNDDLDDDEDDANEDDNDSWEDMSVTEENL